MTLRARAGFTLLEMLISIAVTALIVMTAVQAYRSITRAQEQQAGTLDRERSAQVLLDRLEQELSGTLLVKQPQDADPLQQTYLFYGVDVPSPSGDGDAVRFVTLSPARAPGAPALVPPRMVTYAAVSNDDVGFALVRREAPRPPALDKAIDVQDGQVVLEDLLEFKLSYVLEETGEELPVWDSSEVGLRDSLPSAVNASVTLFELDESGEVVPGPAHERMIPLPMRPIDLEELRAAAAGAGAAGGACLTGAECAAKFGALLEAATPEQRAKLDAELQARAQQCFEPSSPLADVLRDLGADVDSECKS